MTAIPVSTLRSVGATKSLPPELARNVLRNLERHIETHYTRRDGTRLSQRDIAKGMGMAQPVLNQLLAMSKALKDGREKRDPSLGVNTVIKLREALKMPLDELLGLPPLPDQEPRAVILRALDRLSGANDT